MFKTKLKSITFKKSIFYKQKSKKHNVEKQPPDLRQLQKAGKTKAPRKLETVGRKTKIQKG